MPTTKDTIAEMFARAQFVSDLGIEVVRVGDDEVETTMAITSRHLQQHGVVHAGVIGTIADHTAGAAGALHLDATQSVVSIEYKVNLLRPAVGDRLRCVGRALKPGRTVSVAEAEVFAQQAAADRGVAEKLVAKATVTLAVTDRPLLPSNPSNSRSPGV